MMKLRLKLRHRTPPQRRISQSTSRFNIAVWGRQSGKTTFGLDKMLYRPLMGRPGGVYWYILQTYDAAKIAFKRYKQAALQNPQVLKNKPNESDLFFHLCNDATVFFLSGKNYEDLRAQTLDGAIIDEVRQQHPDLWPKVIRPMLARRNAWCDFYSTPNGYDHFHDLYTFALEHPEEWSTFHAPSTEAFWWTPQEVASARATMSEDEFAQEILAQFREIGRGKAYINHGPHNQADQNPFSVRNLPWSPYLPLVVGLDFNVGMMAWVIGQTRAGDFYWGDEIALANTNTQEAVPLLIEKVRGHKPGVILIGDASGKSNKTSASGSTDYSIIMRAMKDAGIPARNLSPDSNPQVKDRINMINGRLKAADGTVHLWYNPKRCKLLKRDLERVTWKQNAQGAILDKSDPLLTHASDAMGYPVCFYADEWKTSPGVLRVIQRG
jgi:hypothetical protein